MTDSVGLRGDRGPILVAMLLAAFLIGIGASVISTLVPAIVADVGGFSSFPWLFSVYLLTMTIIIPVYSKLSDMYGRKTMMLIGLTIFIIGSLLCGIAWDMSSLIAFRVVQALGGGSIQPLALTVIGDVFRGKERAQVQGHIAVTLATASVVGPALGGILALWGLWRVVFLINIPLGLLCIWLIVKDVPDVVERRKHAIDYVGAALLMTSLTLLLTGLLQGGDTWAWASPTSIGLLSTSALLGAGFLWWEQRVAEPVIPLSLFRGRLVVMLAILGLLMGAIMMGLTAFVPTYLQVTAGVSPVWAGVAVAGMAVGIPATTSWATSLYLTWGLRRTTVLGAFVTAVGAMILVSTSHHPNAWVVAVAATLVGMGFGFTTVPGLVALQESVDLRERGTVTGLTTFFRSSGQVVGVAVLGAVAKVWLRDTPDSGPEPDSVMSASTAVFVLVAVFAVLHLAASFGMPLTRAQRPVAEQAARHTPGP